MALQQHGSLETEQGYRSISGLASQCCKVLSVSILMELMDTQNPEGGEIFLN